MHCRELSKIYRLPSANRSHLAEQQSAKVVAQGLCGVLVACPGPQAPRFSASLAVPGTVPAGPAVIHQFCSPVCSIPLGPSHFSFPVQYRWLQHLSQSLTRTHEKTAAAHNGGRSLTLPAGSALARALRSILLCKQSQSTQRLHPAQHNPTCPTPFRTIDPPPSAQSSSSRTSSALPVRSCFSMTLNIK